MPLRLVLSGLACRALGRVTDGSTSRWSGAYVRVWLKPLLVEGLVWIAETAGEPVGFMLAISPRLTVFSLAPLLLTVRGDGQRYKLTLKLDDHPGTAQYQAAFVAPPEWQTLRFKPGDFAASFRGRAVDAELIPTPFYKRK